MSWQDYFVMLIVAVASAYVARRAYRALRGEKAGCGSGCGPCPSGLEEAKRGVLLTIEPPARRET